MDYFNNPPAGWRVGVCTLAATRGGNVIVSCTVYEPTGASHLVAKEFGAAFDVRTGFPAFVSEFIANRLQNAP